MTDEASGGDPPRKKGGAKKLFLGICAAGILLVVGIGAAVLTNPSGVADLLDGMGDSAKSASDSVRPD